jgi:hypothetical protein
VVARLTLFVALVACTACTGQSLYTTPRTVADGRAQLIVAPEYGFRTRRVKQEEGLDSSALPAGLPALHADLRTGVGARGEVGIHSDLIGAFGIDGKWNAVRTGPFDLAFLLRLTASAQRGPQTTDGPYRDDASLHTFLHLPVLVGFNVNPFTFVLSPGTVTLLDGHGRLTQGLRLGAGVQLRLAPWFAVHPEVSWMREVVGPTDMGFATVGLGFLFANLPAHE